MIYIVIGGLVIAVIVSAIALAYSCFNDTDPDMYPDDNYSVIECPHINTYNVVHSTCTVCEEVWTHCTDCGEVIKKRLEC